MSSPIGKTKHMPTLNSLSLLAMATCQCNLCGALAKLDRLEPHPRRDDLEWRSFSCAACGPVKTILVAKPH